MSTSPDDDAGIIRSTTSILSNGPEQIEEDDDGTMLSRQRQAGLEQIADDDPAPVPLAMEVTNVAESQVFNWSDFSKIPQRLPPSQIGEQDIA